MRIKRIRQITAAWIGFGVLVFSVAAGSAGYIYVNLRSGENTGAPMVAVLLAVGSYYLLTFCNLTGGAVLLLFGRDSAVPIPKAVRRVVLLGVAAQLAPLIYWVISH